MTPVPCAHCGYNFMRRTTDPEAIRLCNSCDIRENIRNPPKDKKMETVDILIKCPLKVQAEIEEYCIAIGMDFSKYFLNLHERHGVNKVDFESQAKEFDRQDQEEASKTPTKKKVK